VIEIVSIDLAGDLGGKAFWVKSGVLSIVIHETAYTSNEMP